MLTNNTTLVKAVGFGLVLALATLAGCGGGGGGGGPQADTTPPSVTSPSASPSALDAIGGQVTIQATVTDNVGVSSVTASITGYNPATATTTTRTATLTHTSGNTYVGHHQASAILTVPTGMTLLTYTVSITAKDSSNNTSAAATTAFTVSPPDMPSPP